MLLQQSGEGGRGGGSSLLSLSCASPEIRMLLHSPSIKPFWVGCLGFFLGGGGVGGKIRSPWEWSTGSNTRPARKSRARTCGWKKAAISTVLNTLHGSDGDVPKPLHDLAPNKHAANGKQAFGFPQRGRAGSSPQAMLHPYELGEARGARGTPACPASLLGEFIPK